MLAGMSLEDRLKDLIKQKNRTVKDFALEHNIKYTTLAAILKRGVMNSTIENIVALCTALNISVDALVDGKIIELPQNDLDEDYRTDDFYDLVFTYVHYFEEHDQCALDFMPMSRDEINFFNDSLQLVFDVLRLKRQRGDFKKN